MKYVNIIIKLCFHPNNVNREFSKYGQITMLATGQYEFSNISYYSMPYTCMHVCLQTR